MQADREVEGDSFFHPLDALYIFSLRHGFNTKTYSFSLLCFSHRAWPDRLPSSACRMSFGRSVVQSFACLLSLMMLQRRLRLTLGCKYLSHSLSVCLSVSAEFYDRSCVSCESPSITDQTLKRCIVYTLCTALGHNSTNDGDRGREETEREKRK